MFIDTHCHLSESEGIEPSLYIKNAKEVDVKYLVASFCEKDTYLEASLFLDKYTEIYTSVGFHPEEAGKITEEDFISLEKIIKDYPKVVAVGEIGLDYYWHKDNKEEQRLLFRKQLELAEKYHLPVVIHSRDSINEVYETLKDYSVIGVIHCFSGSLEMAKKFIELGYLIGIGGVLTFKNSKLYQVVEEIPLTKILLETDSPYLSPEPYRGMLNESKNIPIIAKKIAEVKNVSLDEVKRVTTENAVQLFDLKI